MKFVISTQELNYLISKCQNVVPQKPSLSILSNFLIEASGNELVITSTDLTCGVRCYTEAKILEEGCVALPARRFAQLVRELTAVNVEITVSENHVAEIIADSSRFKLHGMGRGDFPSLPEMVGSVNFMIPQKELKDLFFRTSFAVSRDDNRYALTGVNMRIQEGQVTFFGTDGKRLARAQSVLGLDPDLKGSYIIPLKAVDEIIKNLSEDGEAEVSLLADKVAIEAQDTIVVTKLLSGDYPDVTRVIPESSQTLVTLHREELITLLRQITLFIPDTGHSVRFTFGQGELKLTANTMDVGEGKVSMPVNYNGDMLEIAFNPNYLLDILRHSKGEAVTMGITDAFNPGVVVDKDNAEMLTTCGAPLYVLMPMRLN